MRPIFLPFVLLIVVCIASVFLIAPQKAYPDELDDVNKQIADLTDQLSKSVQATKPLESQLDSLKKQIADIKGELAGIDADIVVKKKQIDDGYKSMEAKQQILAETVRAFYIKSYQNSPLLTLLESASATQMTQTLVYERAQTNQDKTIITNIALAITDLEQKEQDLKAEEARLTILRKNLDDQSAKLDTVVAGAKAYQATLNSQITALSAKQQSLLAAKLGSLNIPLYAYNTQSGCSSDLTNGKDPGFSPRFGLFTYGVPNRVGMNQYGAWGRAKQGQNEEQILHAYYNFDSFDTGSYGGVQIKVNDSNGYNAGNVIWTGSLDDYVRRIYEVPDSWADNNLAALKAQAIAARSYVLAQTDNGNKSICATQSCQVFKTDPKGGNWDQAVSATAGKVMVQGGRPITAYFSSTHGGYIYATSDIGWSATSFTKRAQDASSTINSFSDLNNNAYDKDSPWFYCDWGGRSQYSNTAWMTSNEMADIVNSILLVQNDSSADPHILQTDKSDPNMWTADQVKQALSKFRTPFTNISNGSVDVDFANGRTTTIHFSGDQGSVDFSGDVFKKYFNLRAPANIQIVGPVFNVEHR